MPVTLEMIWECVQHIKRSSPLVHNITNFVVMQTTANALLSLGASPIMAHAVEEAEDITSKVNALVVNIGTLSSAWVQAMHLSIGVATRRGIPIVLDPVGVGASDFRFATCAALLEGSAGIIIRGNAAEILALAGEQADTRGVDSQNASNQAIGAATFLAQKYATTVCVSGQEDIITDGVELYVVRGGSPLMPKITGMGCTASALLGAFAAVCPSPAAAAVGTMVVMSTCGELAEAQSNGTGSFAVHFLDALYSLTYSDIMCQAKFEVIDLDMYSYNTPLQKNNVE